MRVGTSKRLPSMRDFATLAQRAGKDLAFQVAASAAMRVLHKVLVPLLVKRAPRLKRAVDLAIQSPFERVKTLLQITPGASAIEVATRAVAADGAAGCLRRVALDVCLDLLRGLIGRRITGRLKPLMKGWKGPFLPPAANGVFLGSVATAVTLAATYPIDALRTRNYAGEELAFVWSGWYRGYGFAVAGGALHRGVYVFRVKAFREARQAAGSAAGHFRRATFFVPRRHDSKAAPARRCAQVPRRARLPRRHVQGRGNIGPLRGRHVVGSLPARCATVVEYPRYIRYSE